ncbi:hypothetical protein HK100_010321 [Physocladia obscura]|uniref:Uncharacterized protein n=1 Tax=Physocladia obscura TaxID=109957 RepID=A0AAD5T3Q8_9FUNG|nr:hypothetical protein HK100_010321 [Physocladia obscura]
MDSAAAPKHRSFPRPDKEKHHAELDAIKAQIEVLQKQMAALQSKIGSTDNIKTTYDVKITDLKSQLDSLAKERTDINNARNKKMEQIKALSTAIKKKTDDAKTAKDSVKNVADIEARISNLERQISTGSLNINEEKRVVADISALKKQRKMIESAPAGSAVSTVEADKAEVEGLKAELDVLKPRKDEVNAKYDVVKAELNKLNESKKTDRDSFSTLLNEKKELKAQIDALFEEQRAKRDSFKARNEEWLANTKAEREARDQFYKEQKKAEATVRLQKVAEQALENAEIPAFTEEINICNSLVAFLAPFATPGKVVANTVEATTSAFAATNLRKVEAVIPDGAVALKKKDDREEDFFMGGKKGKGKKAPAAAPVTKPFKIDLVTLELFGKLKLEIPVAAGAGVDTAIDAIEAKKAQYLADQAAQTLKNKAAAEARIAALKISAEEGKLEEAIEALEEDVNVEEIAA